VIDYLELDAAGAPVRRTSERLAYFMTDPAPFARAAGFAPDCEPLPLGGVGEIFVYRKL
jgi:hypothetical protein